MDESFQICVFLARVVVAAQTAQRYFGVPASVLIAEVAMDFGWNSDFFIEFAEHHIGKGWKVGHDGSREATTKVAHCIADAIEYGFFKEAEWLATSEQFEPAMKYSRDPIAYVKELSDLGLLDSHGTRYERDLIEKIEDWDLGQCDDTAKLPLGTRVSELPYGPEIRP